MAARIERRELRGATAADVLQYPRGYSTRGTVHARERGQERLAPSEASNLIVASCLTITDTGFFFIAMTDLTPKEIS